jgi:predicted GTPase
MGAAGRDFHNFNLAFRDDPAYEVVAFTAAQIPNIEGRRYPPELAGMFYPQGIPIHAEAQLEALITDLRVDLVVFSYSDVSHEHVMHMAARALSRGADFKLLGPRTTMLKSCKPVISVCAVRTGCGKSPAARKIAGIVRSHRLRVGIIRHPMPYGNLARQVAQRFASLEDLAKGRCTIEEMEEYEPHIRNGDFVYAGVDYEKILHLAETEADVILWDGGNNDTPFLLPDLEIVLLDPHRAGHELKYFPGEVNFRRAHVLILNKLDTADAGEIAISRDNIHRFNPQAIVVDAAMPVTVDRPEIVGGKRVLVVEDGPTLTHGGMSFGAGHIAATKFGARELVDPRRFAIGSIKQALVDHPHIDRVLPAMGYGDAQVHELERTIHQADCDLVVIATPVDLRRIIKIQQPTCRVFYELEEIGSPTLTELLQSFVEKTVKLSGKRTTAEEPKRFF